MVSANMKTAFVLFGLMGAMATVPLITRTTSENLMDKEKLSGSQRQRGMNLMAGQQDAGADPNWDSKTGTYQKYKKPELDR